MGKPPACQVEIRPIYPARFSLTKTALDKIAKTGEAPPMPTGIKDPNYELRRLRQGYFYIYSQKHVGKTTDLKGQWLIFKYTVSDDDSNATELRGEEGNLPYQFTQYEWTEGNPRKEWVPAKGVKTHYHAFVNPQTAIIEFAYSEFRWPAELFEKLEVDPATRAKIMQKLALKQLESDFSFVLTEQSLQTLVPDFNPKSSDTNQNAQYRATTVGYNAKQDLMLTTKPCENGEPIVVAVFDPIGNIYDIAACSVVAVANDATERAKELYPVTTARAVKSFEKLLRTKSYSGFPVGEANQNDHIFSGIGRVFSKETNDGTVDNKTWRQMEQYLKYRPTKYEDMMINLAKAHRALAEQADNYTIIAQMAIINGLMLDYQKQPNKLYPLTNYMMELIIAAQSGISTRAKGMSEQAEMLRLAKTKLNDKTGLPDNLEKSPKSYGDYIGNLLSIGDKSNSIVKDGTVLIEFNRIRFDVLLGEISAGQLHLWQRTATNSLMYHSYLNVLGFRLTPLQPTGIKTALEELKAQMKAIASGRVTHIDLPKAVLQRRDERILSVWMNIDAQDQSNASKWINTNTRYAGIFLASITAIANLQKWTELKDEKGVNGLAVAQVTADLSAIVAAFERKKNDLAEQATEKLFQKLNKAAMRYGLPFPGATAQPGTRIWDKVISFDNVGRIAGVMAIIIAYNDFKQGGGSGDKAKRDAAVLLATGEIFTLLSTFSFVSGLFPALGIVGAALVILSVVVSTFGDNPYEAWVRTGFWGNSESYWDDDQRLKLEERLLLAKNLSSQDSTRYWAIKKFFDKEMEAYYNLAWGLTVSAKNNQWQVLEVSCPAFLEEKDYAARIEVSVTQYGYAHPGSADEALVSLQGKEEHLTPKRTENNGNAFIYLSEEKCFRGYKSIEVVNTQRYPTNDTDIFVIKVKYPKLGEKTDTFWQRRNADYFEGEIVLEGKY
ncbi:hypothetical protein D3M79_08250 [Rodentibacter pneumotropicus]|uniref:Toxin VasX N-terminal region domain-containing protein n=1 Tax=Rodentibacter pneumotropicus TaxID=758 RepID=A0A4S2P810_9PAST|nr:hypothetical protein D3M79_08250 [Rodentibacter pneumotropicus]TGZ99662.1 hypothetical protein D3M74_09370 [Rodentibacter pneumotropicus]THA05661.1 hypothetical protein D3M77_09225 [Rodentibacter pneumotropicus]THA13567.1 hypothetical protein D3M76_08690 [Rodentibacter pneumotropicus]